MTQLNSAYHAYCSLIVSVRCWKISRGRTVQSPTPTKMAVLPELAGKIKSIYPCFYCYCTTFKPSCLWGFRHVLFKHVHTYTHTVQTTFVVAGLHLGFILYLQQANDYSEDVVRLVPSIVVGPLVVTAIAAAVTAALLYTIKRRSRVEQFRQPQLLIVASLCMVFSAVPYLFEDCM